MKRKQLTFIVILLSSLCLFTAAGIFAGETPASSTDLSVKWGELTAPGTAAMPNPNSANY